MGNQKDVMDDFALKELRHIYSTYDGWKMTPQKMGSGYDTLVRLERMTVGHRDIVKVLVSFSKEVPADMVDELSKKERMSDGGIARYDSAVIVPVNANTASLPAGMKVYTMESFEFKGNDLSWTKKKVAKAPEAAP